MQGALSQVLLATISLMFRSISGTRGRRGRRNAIPRQAHCRRWRKRVPSPTTPSTAPKVKLINKPGADCLCSFVLLYQTVIWLTGTDMQMAYLEVPKLRLRPNPYSLLSAAASCYPERLPAERRKSAATHQQLDLAAVCRLDGLRFSRPNVMSFDMWRLHTALNERRMPLLQVQPSQIHDGSKSVNPLPCENQPQRADVLPVFISAQASDWLQQHLAASPSAAGRTSLSP